MIKDIQKFMRIGEQQVEVLDFEQLGLYIGLQLEEMAEKLEVLGLQFLADTLHEFSVDFKAGRWNTHLVKLREEDLVKLLDADLDLAWVSIGAASSLGVDVHGAFIEVAQSNMSKASVCDVCCGYGAECISCAGEGLKMKKDGNGKIVKGHGYYKPNLEKFFIK